MNELKQRKLWFGKECLGLLNQRKQAKMQWVQNLSQKSVDNLNNVRLEANRHFRKKRRHILKLNLRNLKLTVRSKILGTCIRALMTSRRGTSLEVL
jgi:hypothetical protein